MDGDNKKRCLIHWEMVVCVCAVEGLDHDADVVYGLKCCFSVDGGYASADPWFCVSFSLYCKWRIFRRFRAMGWWMFFAMTDEKWSVFSDQFVCQIGASSSIDEWSYKRTTPGMRCKTDPFQRSIFSDHFRDECHQTGPSANIDQHNFTKHMAHGKPIRPPLYDRHASVQSTHINFPHPCSR